MPDERPSAGLRSYPEDPSRLGAVLAAVKERGGKALMDPTVIAGVGTLAFFEDTEGNVVGAMQYDAAAD